ncbi:hypothetical protein ACWGOQ_0014360 [Aquimarina sp. M1]
MSTTNSTYNIKLILNWFITLLLFLGIGGYTKYTQPISCKESIELVISEAKSYTSSISFSEATYAKRGFNNLTSFAQLSKYHSHIYRLKYERFDNKIALASISRKRLRSRDSIYTTDEDPFHFG